MLGGLVLGSDGRGRLVVAGGRIRHDAAGAEQHQSGESAREAAAEASRGAPTTGRRGRLVPRDRFRELYAQEEERVLALFAETKENRSGGGNFYNVQSQRLSRQFARAVVASAREGGTSYRDAYKLLGTKKHSTFEALAERVGTR
ncbi:hypothetical protein [Brachybacterium paraconglomeratum]|uniref:hypothetical protein n=1 Tax=Brachybacterium paraconglomeratum TaxID=173362 RepID=UPI0022B04707|nr:hypothetical protein [Brachybacterium paraconglomeratum]MCZ4326150.1 hypothetical protein [Brachybacterium paraconglomeratum]